MWLKNLALLAGFNRYIDYTTFVGQPVCNVQYKVWCLFAEKPIEMMKPIRQEQGRKVAGKFQGEPTYQGNWVHPYFIYNNRTTSFVPAVLSNIDYCVT